MILINTLQHLLQQIKEYLIQLSPAQYAQTLEVYSGASIGQHTRHMIEFLQCFLRQYPSGIINYDARQRKADLEQLPQAALQAIAVVENCLNTVQEQPHKLQLLLSYPQAANAIFVTTNLEREIAYNIEHIIHHLAIIKIGLLIQVPHIKLSPDFGVAYSTIQYRSLVR